MLWRMGDLRELKLRATDGALGSVHDAFFDDEDWKLRWLVVDTAWLFGRRVLLAPPVLGQPNADARELPVSLSQEKIKSAPDVATEKPVRRQQEEDLYGYYGWSPYWAGGPASWSTMPVPPSVGYPLMGRPVEGAPPSERGVPETGEEGEKRDPHLRSAREVAGYYIQATDGEIGHVEEFVVDVEDWAIRYLIVDTRNWLPGRHVLIAPSWVREISWSRETVRVALARKQIEQAPEYDAATRIDRGYEARLHRHYRQKVYWE